MAARALPPTACCPLITAHCLVALSWDERFLELALPLIDGCWDAAACAPLVGVWRRPVLESVHYGAVAVASADGTVVASHGDPRLRTYLRSSAKPFQLLGLVEHGGIERFGLDSTAVAVMAASHGGEPQHVEAVGRILKAIDCGVGDLQCGVHPPMDASAARALLEAGEVPTALHSNCSGKHAGMLALCRLLGEPIASYLDPEHPAQRLIRSRVAASLRVAESDLTWGVDGCGAPAFTSSLVVMARAYAWLVEPPDQLGELAAAARRITAAMRRHPELVGGSRGRLDTELMRLDSRFISKSGADGVFCVGVPSELAVGRPLGVALKVSDGDGATRARIPAGIEALCQLGALADSVQAELARRFPGELKNVAGRVVGDIRPCYQLQRADGSNG